MSTIIPAMRQHLLDEGFESVFMYHMGDEVKEGILLLDPPSGAPIDPDLPGYRKTGFQVVIRASEHLAGETQAQKVSDALSIERRMNMSRIDVNYVRPRHEPIRFPKSGGGRLEFSINFDACYVI